MNSKYKFLIAGGSNTAITFGLYALLISLGFHYNLALGISYVLGIIQGFIINRLWTFSSAQPSTSSNAKSARTQFLQYVIVHALIFSVNFLILNLLVQAFTLSPILSQLFAVSVATVCSYILQRGWVFKG